MEQLFDSIHLRQRLHPPPLKEELAKETRQTSSPVAIIPEATSIAGAAAGFAKHPRYANAFETPVKENNVLAALSFMELVGGNSNRVYLAYPSPDASAKGLPVMVLREYGAALDSFLDREKELAAANAMSDAGLAPEVIVTFQGGRFERFVQNSATATTADLLTNRELVSEMMRKTRALHSMRVESNVLCPSQPCLIPRIRLLAEAATKHTKESDQDASLIRCVGKEIDELEALLAKRTVCFCHNDLNPGNILWNNNAPGGGIAATFIDFEYTDYSYRGFDLGNMFCELGYDYADTSSPSGFVKPFYHQNAEWCRERNLSPTFPYAAASLVHGKSLPEGHPMNTFSKTLHHAIDEYDAAAGNNDISENGAGPISVDEILEGMLASNLQWGLWSIVVACGGDNRVAVERPPAVDGSGSGPVFHVGASGLDNVDYGHARFCEYVELKKWLADGQPRIA